MGESQSKNSSRKSNISEEVSNFDHEWQKLSCEEKEKNDPNKNNDLERFYSALEYSERNRYPEVLALENTRVKLLHSRNDSDYINANWVDGVLDDSKKKYIAAQAPLPQTFSDFWSMVWDQNIKSIIMLTNLHEGGKVKAHAYWPNHSSKQYGDIFVLLDSEEEFLDGVIVKREFILSKNLDITGLRVASTITNSKKSERKIIQYHYTTWPDHGAPVESDSILTLIDSVDNYLKKKNQQKNLF